MIYIDDCLRAIIEFMTCKEIDLKSRTYNISAISFTPKELENALQKYIPDFIMTYRPDWRQDIGKLKFWKSFLIKIFFNFEADSWPKVLDDQNARKEWNWRHKYDLDKLCRVMIENISQRCQSVHVNYDALRKENHNEKEETSKLSSIG